MAAARLALNAVAIAVAIAAPEMARSAPLSFLDEDTGPAWRLADVDRDATRTMSVPYETTDATHNGTLVWSTGKRGEDAADVLPLVLIAPDFDGVGAFELQQAARLASEGYVAFVLDTYGTAVPQGSAFDRTDPDARPRMGRFHANSSAMWREATLAGKDAALTAAVYANVWTGAYAGNFMGSAADNVRIGLYGYCFGAKGAVALARLPPVELKEMGFRVLAGFHPGDPNGDGTMAFAPDERDGEAARLLVLNGDVDDGWTDAEREKFSKELAGAGTWLDFSVITLGRDVPHAWTEPGRTDRYREVADRDSWAMALSALQSGVAAPLGA